jgi:hypothetical protein
MKNTVSDQIVRFMFCEKKGKNWKNFCKIK